MMRDMAPGMMLGMGLIGLLVVAVLLLAAAALVKYLRSSNKGGGIDEETVDVGVRGRHRCFRSDGAAR
jgi:hypothetical protein